MGEYFCYTPSDMFISLVWCHCVWPEAHDHALIFAKATRYIVVKAHGPCSTLAWCMVAYTHLLSPRLCMGQDVTLPLRMMYFVLPNFILLRPRDTQY